MSVIPINIMEEMAPWVKSYIDLAIAIDGKTTQKELKKEVQEGKNSEHHPLKCGQDDHKRHPRL